MKKDIHPEYKAAKLICVCGHVVETRTTVGDIKVELCSNCHPFYTGKEKIIDTAGRIDKFNKKYQIKKEATAE